MTDPIAFRPTEQAEKYLTDFMTKQSIAKKSDAVNRILEGCFSLSLNPEIPTDPIEKQVTSTPLTQQEKHALSIRAADFILNIPLDVWNEIKELADNEHEAIQYGLRHNQLGNLGKLGGLFDEIQRSTKNETRSVM